MRMHSWLIPIPSLLQTFIRRDTAGRINWHYAIIEVRAGSRSCCSKFALPSVSLGCGETRKGWSVFAGSSNATGPTSGSAGLCRCGGRPLGTHSRARRHARWAILHIVQVRSAA